MYYKLILLPFGWWSHSNRRWRTCRRWSQIERASSGVEPSLSADRASTWLAVSSGAYSTNVQYFDFTIIPRSSFTFHPSHVSLYVSLFTTHSPTVRDTFFTPLSKLAIEEWGKSLANRVYTLIYTSSIDLSNFFVIIRKERESIWNLRAIQSLLQIHRQCFLLLSGAYQSRCDTL